MTLLQVIAATLLGGVVSLLLAGAIGLRLPDAQLRRMIGFAAGVLLAAALLDLLPEALALGAPPASIGLALLGSVLVLHMAERVALWRHHHSPVHGPGSARVAAVVLGDGAHNFVDGVLIAAAFSTDSAVGWSTTFAVVAHEIPQEIGDFVLLRDAGLSRARALALNALSSLASVAGGVVGWLLIQSVQAVLPYLLGFAAGAFVYVALTDLLPMLRAAPDRGLALRQSGALLVGAGLMGALGGLLR